MAIDVRPDGRNWKCYLSLRSQGEAEVGGALQPIVGRNANPSYKDKLRGRTSIRQARPWRASELEDVAEQWQLNRVKRCRYPTPARRFARFTTPAASSSPIRGTSAPRVICAIAASRRWRPRAQARHSAWVFRIAMAR